MDKTSKAISGLKIVNSSFDKPHKNRKIMEELLSKKTSTCKPTTGLIFNCKFISGFIH